ncbi:Fe-S cluster assembly ATPase SufC [Caldivirga sp. UBA161]|uniref:Fe-S cluster assembly ATPase SufC n=1 Tax=Caldivirga sp. UBA161 TaxID=1915569 RepID=UPI0025C684E7|nr:Fe-S cluster assembly ATPase SufC [Caldivirga sp. UBA161]
MAELKVENLTVSVDGKVIIEDVSFSVKSGEVLALMGPNGSGKTTLFMTIAGHPKYNVIKGRVLLDNDDLTPLLPEERVMKGIMVAFQTPIAVPEVRLSTLITAMVNKMNGRKLTDPAPPSLVNNLIKGVQEVGLTPAHLSRGVNHGFSGGEMKRSEVLQLLMAKPKIALIDEPDSGLDVDGVYAVGKVLLNLVNSGTGIVLTTHSARILHTLKPTKVLVLSKGRIIAEGGLELVEEIEKIGYENFLKVR